MGRRRALIPTLAAALLITLEVAAAGCASEAGTRKRRERTPTAAWFGVRGARCAEVLPVLGASLRAGTVAPWRLADEGPWCAVAASDGGEGLRIDSTAQRVSGALGLPAVSFFVGGGAWSYTVFDRGEPLLTLEAHLGEPMLTGDRLRAAALFEVEPELVEASVEHAREIGALRPFADAIGLHDPAGERHARIVEAPVDANRPDVPAPGDAPARPPDKTLARLPPGAWAALPPLGVVLVKAVELRPGDGTDKVLTYVIVDDMATLTLPVTRAEAMGMRPVATGAEADRALSIVEHGSDPGDEDYDAARVKRWLEAMRGGELAAIAKVYAQLCGLRAERQLYQVEEGLLSTSREWLAEEIATAKHSQVDATDAVLRKICK